MAYYDDLSEWPVAGVAKHATRAVGWLERGRPYLSGDTSKQFFGALISLLVEPWRPFAEAGRHPCSMCAFSGGPTGLSYQGVRIAMGSSTLFVPGDAVIYVAPSLIAHYVDAHGYLPPQEFVDAVIACPPMRSIQYLRSIKALGGHELMALSRNK